MNKNIFQSLKIVAIVLTLSIGISYVSAWTAPTATPPNSNVSAPINVSSSAQIKTGDFSVWNLVSNGVVTNNAVVTNSIAGNTVATNNLVVATGAAAGKVLTSDASGNATWQPASGGSSYVAGNGLTLVGNTFSTNTAQTQARVGGSCVVGSSIRVINANGTVSCEIDDVGGAGSDNLGNHTATQGLNMASNYIYGLPSGNAISWGSSAGAGNSIYSDGAGGNMAVRTSGQLFVQNQSGAATAGLTVGNINSDGNITTPGSVTANGWVSTNQVCIAGVCKTNWPTPTCSLTSQVLNDPNCSVYTNCPAGWTLTGRTTNAESGQICRERSICSRITCP